MLIRKEHSGKVEFYKMERASCPFVLPLKSIHVLESTLEILGRTDYLDSGKFIYQLCSSLVNFQPHRLFSESRFGSYGLCPSLPLLWSDHWRLG